jgi:hypothetical protein
MHRCFLISEITHVICTELSNVWAREPLARLARTCQALREPALDALWYELHGLIPLVKCMPKDLWMESDEYERPLVRLIIFPYHNLCYS